MADEDRGERVFTKTDMERVALFKEMGYVTVGDKYAVPQTQFNVSASKGKQILNAGPKSKSGLQDGYFNDKFTRVMEGEAYSDQIKMRRQRKLHEAKRNIGKDFIPSSGDKKMSGLGSYYGTLAGPVEAFSPETRQRKRDNELKKNFYTNPGKKGTGYGYVGVTFSNYNEYSADDYDASKAIVKKEYEEHRKAMKGKAFKLSGASRAYFDANPYVSDKALPPEKEKSSQKPVANTPFKPTSPAKKDGGMKAGTFDPYPAYNDDTNMKKRKTKKPTSAKSQNINKVFIPPAGIKSAPQNSVLHQNVTRSVHAQNYKTIQTVMAY